MLKQSNLYLSIFYFLFYHYFQTYSIISLSLNNLTFRYLNNQNLKLSKNNYFQSETNQFVYFYSKHLESKLLIRFYKLNKQKVQSINFYKFYIKKYIKLNSSKIINNFLFKERLLMNNQSLLIFWYMIFLAIFKKNYHQKLYLFNQNTYTQSTKLYLKKLNKKFNKQLNKKLYFYNFNKSIFKKAFKLRVVQWNIWTAKKRTKQKYLKFTNIFLKTQQLHKLVKYQIFYILRQIDFILSWAHLDYLVSLNVITINNKILTTVTQIKKGDIIGCPFGPTLYYYFYKLLSVNKKYLQRTKRTLFFRKVYGKKYINEQIPKQFKLIPYYQTGGLNFCSFDYSLNLICIIRSPITLNLRYKQYYSNLSLFRLSVWRYNV